MLWRHGPSGPAARLLLPLTDNPVPSPGVIVFSSTDVGNLQDLRMREQRRVAIILLVRQYQVFTGFIFEGEIVKSKWVDKYCAPLMLGHNLPIVLSNLLRSGNGEWWMVSRSESRLRWWSSLPG